MSNEISEKPPAGPWDAPLREYVKSHILVISIYNIKNDELVKRERIDYGNYEHRKFLGRVTFWATQNGYSVETMSELDYKKYEAEVDEKTVKAKLG